ncbi:MAG TPA: hypothetical protein ENL46_00965 [Candidatus Aminicenantes bacterium]|nr:hypothetical protein [Candidatus Aminicenantes bacterium]
MAEKIRLMALILIISILTLTPKIYSESGRTIIEELKDKAPKVFLDCWRCDRDYIRKEITYVNFVRDRTDADIHILVTDENTGSGGNKYTLTFIGRNQFEDMEKTLTYSSNETETWDEIREGMLEVMKKGLFPFLMKTPIADLLTIQCKQDLEPTAVKDNWNFWVFNIRLSGELEEERSKRATQFNWDLSANRVTPEWKIQLGASGDYKEDNYDYEDYSIKSISKEKDLRGLFVKSLNEHWSIGSWIEASSSTYSNIEAHYMVAPALEYNFFPYSQSTRRQLRCLYRIGFHSVNYIERTIYDQTKENLFNESLTLTLEIREPWGSASTSLEGSHYFHDLSKNRFELRGFLSVRIFKGFSINLNGRYDRIHDQLSLPIGGASLDEILLQRKELATNYEYSIDIGFSYTFGSVYSNVVNPRFGGRSRYGRYR